MLDFLISILLPCVVAFILTLILGKVLIPFLTKLKVGNTEREELESHQVKNGTPSMGGIMFLVAVLIVSAFYIRSYPNVFIIAAITFMFGLIGFMDDWLKTVKRKSDGLLAWQKFGLQFIVTTVFLLHMWFSGGINLDLIIPFTEYTVNIGYFSIPLFYLAVMGTVNGVNFTDGLDGLASTVTIIVTVFFTAASMYLLGGIEPITSAMIGALMGFLVYNVYPAKIFMGDTGSLALGGFVASVAYVLNMPIFIVIVGLIYLVEVVSVILQVGYFKITHGKRIFKMAPIHHHFELSGWSEVKVVAVFSIITVILCLIGFTGLLAR